MYIWNLQMDYHNKLEKSNYMIMKLLDIQLWYQLLKTLHISKTFKWSPQISTPKGQMINHMKFQVSENKFKVFGALIQAHLILLIVS